jgi:hypothetical protein
MAAMLATPGQAWCHGGTGTKEARMFFFEKKNQKTFPTLRPFPVNQPRQKGKSLFASFSSEKEDSSL